MKTLIVIFLSLISIHGMSQNANQQVSNVFYCFNNGVRTLLNPPQGMEAQAQLIKKLGFDGFAGHHSEDYFARREVLDKVSLAMPEAYWPIVIDEHGKATYKEGLYDIIKDSKDRNLLVALYVTADSFTTNQEEGDQHLVITGVCIRSTQKNICFDVVSKVWFEPLDKEEIDYYIEKYQPYDKAGSYGIQEWLGYIAIEKIEGSYYNIMGMPVHKIYEELKRFD